MARPRKNRIGEYAAQLAEEIAFHMGKDLMGTVAESQEAYQKEIAELRAEIRSLKRQVDVLSRKNRSPKQKTKVGRWVPGGPGRPPKDAAERIAAFSSRSSGLGPSDDGDKAARPRPRRGRAGSPKAKNR